MIITTLNGGLGNQMSQYALGRILAEINSTQLHLDTSWYRSLNSPDTPRQYELGIFGIKPDSFMQNIYKFLPRKLIAEKSVAYDPSVLSLKGSIKLVGYWQSEKYFVAYRNLILKVFSFHQLPNGINRKLISKIKKTESVSIHVRRGDYVHVKTTNNFHGVCNVNYYQKAIKYLSGKLKNPSYYVFSDDIEWCKQNLGIKGNVIYVEHNLGDKSWEDMRLMSLCKHNIIANSSFSWWGAWLNQNPAKIVIAPKQWFKDATVNTDDLIPDQWIKM